MRRQPDSGAHAAGLKTSQLHRLAAVQPLTTPTQSFAHVGLPPTHVCLCPPLQRLYDMAVIPTPKSLVQTEQLSTASFCRRRLAVVLVRLKMAESVREAATFVEQGHVRVGPNTVTDPAFHVTRHMEDFVTWVDTSKIKRKVRGRGCLLPVCLFLSWGRPTGQ